MKRVIILLVISAICVFSTCEQPQVKGYGIVFYNCEQLFDTLDNPTTADDDFTPTGAYQYNTRTYLQKLHNMAMVLQSIRQSQTGFTFPIWGLAEVEQGNVLAHLLQQPELAKQPYKYVTGGTDDRRGIAAALVYDTSLFRVCKATSYTVAGLHTRDILYVCGVLGGDTLHVLVNHWPSRRGGEEESEEKRCRAAECARRVYDSLVNASANARIVVMGDFNDNPADSAIHSVLGADGSGKGTLYNPYAAMHQRGLGTEYFAEQWNMFDQIMISRGLRKAMPANGELRYDTAIIYHPAFIANHDTMLGNTPRRSYLGHKWMNGYSDHLPVVVYLKR